MAQVDKYEKKWHMGKNIDENLTMSLLKFRIQYIKGKY